MGTYDCTYTVSTFVRPNKWCTIQAPTYDKTLPFVDEYGAADDDAGGVEHEHVTEVDARREAGEASQ